MTLGVALVHRSDGNDRVKSRIAIAVGGIGLAFVAALVMVALFQDLGVKTAGRLHAQLKPGMTYGDVVDIVAAEPKGSFICQQRTGIQEPPCRRILIVGQGAWLASHSFAVEFDGHARVTSIGAPGYDPDLW
jgi:hypothetical protein